MTHTSALKDVEYNSISFGDSQGEYRMEINRIVEHVHVGQKVAGWITYNPGKKNESKRPFSMPLEAWSKLTKSTTSTALPGAAAEEPQGQENN